LRPRWRGATEERISAILGCNYWLKANAASTSPPMTLLDTSDADEAETVSAVADWVRQHLRDG
jgi:hypothetical protein